MAGHGNPEITNYFAIKINWKGRRQNVRVDRSPGSRTVAVQGDNPQVTIEQNPSLTAKELVETVYVPLLKEASSWLDPSKSPLDLGTWTELEQKAPHLLRLVPANIRDLFKKSQTISSRISALTLLTYQIFRDAEMNAFRQLRMNISSQYAYAGFGVLQGTAVLESVGIPKIWISGKSLEKYAQDFVDEKYRGIDWTLDLRVDSSREGDKTGALRFASEALSFLEKNQTAIELREKYAELKQLGVKIRPLIEKELDKLVRLDLE